MLNNKKNGMMKKLTAMGLVLVMAVGLGVSAFASGQPENGGNMGGMNAGRIGMTENASSGNMGDPGRNMNSQMPAQDNSQQPDDRLPSGTEQPDAAPAGEDTAPADEPNAAAGEDVPEKPENDLQPDDAQASGEPAAEKMPDNGEIKTDGIDMKAVESYIQAAGDNADENVRAAYDALAEALAEDPNEAAEEDMIAGLESALTDALTNADVDLGQYEQTPDQANAPSGEPAGESFGGASGEPNGGASGEPAGAASGAASGEMQNSPENGSEGQRENGSEKSTGSQAFYTMIRMFLDRFISFLRNL